MKRGGKIVFAEDDLCYQFDESINIVVAPLLRDFGYSDFGADGRPRCGDRDIRVVRGLLGLPNYGYEDFACTDLDENDFIKAGPKWQLRSEAIEALTRSSAG